MREKLIVYVQSLFRSAADTPQNRDLEAEILQNSLDRFDDLVNGGVPEEEAYRQAVESLGDVRQLLHTGRKKKRTARNVAILCTAAVLVLAAMPLVLFGMDHRLERLEDRVERETDHWAEKIEDNVEQWVDQMDEEFGYSVLLPNSTVGYPDSERYTVGEAEVEAASLEELSIDWIAGTVAVEVWDGETVSIAETGAETQAEQVHWLLDNGRLDIHYCAAGTHLTLPRKELTVRIPKALAQHLQCLWIDGTSQETVITDVTADQVWFRSVSGMLNFRGGAESLHLETTSGNMTLKLDKAPDRIDYDNVSGNLELIFPKEGRGFEVDWDTVSGEFDCSFPGKRTEDEWVFNPEENYAIRGEYEFETVSGDVTIKKG